MSKCHLTKLLGIIVIASAWCAHADAPAITGVTAKQRYPWNGKVDITYTLMSDVTAGSRLFVTASNRVDGMTYAASASVLSGDTGTVEGAHHVVWDLDAQGIEFKSDDVVFTVAYAVPQCCVIDLSAGANATSYPVTYMAQAPNGGFNTDEYKTTKLVLRRIEPGSFMMRGQYDVTLTKAYYMGVFEVTQKQYELVMGSNPSQYKGDMRPVEKVSYDMIRGSSNGASWPSSSDVDSTSFMGKMRARTGLAFDLPTESQWEYACRAGTTSDYNNGGSTTNDLNVLGRYQDNQSDGSGGYSAKHTSVGSYLANAWGLYDMHGNVWEWCLGWSGGTLSGGNDPEGPSTGGSRRLRGGSWYVIANNCTSASATGSTPSLQHNHVGFRIAWTLPNAENGPSHGTLDVGAWDDAWCIGDSVPVVIDSRVGVEPLLDSIELPWTASWIGGDTNATVVIADNGTKVTQVTGTGEFMHALYGIGRHELKYATYVGGVAEGETYTAVMFKDWKYTLEDGEAIITGTTQTNGIVEIPFEINGWPVKGIAEEVFVGCSGLSDVTIPFSVTNIGERAFANCIGLTHVEVPRGLKDMIETRNVFAGCSANLEIEYISPQIRNVTAKQRYPWNGKVDITYELVGDLTAALHPILSVSATNRVVETNYVADANALSGETGTAAGMHHVVWDLNQQGIEFKSDDVVFSVAYVIPQYCVVDLSAGANATGYPVAYMVAEPIGGFNTDEYKTTKLVLRLIEPGSFMMCGQYDVTLTKPFYCGLFEVTQRQYELVTGSNPSSYKGDMRPVESMSWNTIRGDSGTYNWPNLANVDPNSFVGRIQARTGLNFDLPTEAQWEYACRAGTTSSYNNGGGSEEDLKQLGRYRGNWSDGKGGYSEHTNVGSYLPNAWGLYDMHGNAWEWCLDWYGGLTNGVTDPNGSSSGSSRVVRGGSWWLYAVDCTSSHRSNFSPSDVYSYYGFGFRLVRTLSD